MENQDFNKELLDYLYGEMNSTEKNVFERKMNEDEALQKEYNELVSVKKELENLKDKEVMEPFSAWGKSRNKGWFNAGQRKRAVIFRPITAIAASLLILLTVGYFTDFSLSVNGQGFHMGFGNEADTKWIDYMNKEEVQQLIEQGISNNNQKLTAQLSEAKDAYNKKLLAFESALNNLKNEHSSSAFTREDIQDFFNQTDNNNTELIKEYMKMTSNQQQKYFKEMFTQFNNFYREQRKNDMAIIQNSLLEINQQQAIQKLETDQALAGLYSTVSKGSN